MTIKTDVQLARKTLETYFAAREKRWKLTLRQGQRQK